MSFSIDGKTAIVTGAANGLGLAIARHFLDRGARVMFADQDEEKLEAEIGDEVRGEGAARMFAGDLREKLAITNLLSATIDAFDPVSYTHLDVYKRQAMHHGKGIGAGSGDAGRAA